MNKCRNPDHPHCTVWVMPGEAACAHGHPQPAAAPGGASDVLKAPSAVAIPRPGAAAGHGLAIPAPCAPLRTGPHLHVSGFDPRTAGGRQAIRLEARGIPPIAQAELQLRLTSALPLRSPAHQGLARTRGGGWRPVFIEFSSRGVEHGQHRIEVELQADGRSWACTLVLLLPPPSATLGDIHQAFLATHKNVKVSAEDGSIARLNGPSSGRMDIEVSARDASIAQLNLVPEQGKIDVGFATIAWDEELVELDTAPQVVRHPCPASSACLVNDGGNALPRHLRLFALDEFVLGRLEPDNPQADILLAHFTADGSVPDGLTRRLSARHALIRRGRDGFEIEDISRFGLLVDGAWPGKHVPVLLREGMRIELTASIRGVVTLVVLALHPHAVVLQRADSGAKAECFYLLAPGRHPGTEPARPAVPVLFHLHGGFWHLDPAGHETALGPGCTSLPGGASFSASAYPELWNPCAPGRRRGQDRVGWTAPP
jgi:hypothetical protein